MVRSPPVVGSADDQRDRLTRIIAIVGAFTGIVGLTLTIIQTIDQRDRDREERAIELYVAASYSLFDETRQRPGRPPGHRQLEPSRSSHQARRSAR